MKKARSGLFMVNKNRRSMLKKSGIAGIILLTVAAMLMTLGVLPAVASGDNGSNGTQVFNKNPSTPLTIDAYWSAFSWGPGQPVYSYDGPFTFNNVYNVRVVVTDAFWKGDRFRIYDNGIPLGETSSVPVDANGDVEDPDVALRDPTYSHGSDRLPPGSHSLSIEVISNPFNGGVAFIRVQSIGLAAGGEIYPANKLGLIAPWVALIPVLAAGGIYLVRRRAYRQK
jgi:hypothetical protein